GRVRVTRRLRVEPGFGDRKGNAQHLARLGLRRCAERRKRRAQCERRDDSSDHSAFSISAVIDSGVSFGAKRAMTLPPRSMRNLVKFHLIASVPSNPGLADFK